MEFWVHEGGSGVLLFVSISCTKTVQHEFVCRHHVVMSGVHRCTGINTLGTQIFWNVSADQRCLNNLALIIRFDDINCIDNLSIALGYCKILTGIGIFCKTTYSIHD